MQWLDDRLGHTLRRGQEWLAPSTKPKLQDLKDKATVAVADLLAAQKTNVTSGMGPPVVRLPNGDYIYGNPYQAARSDWSGNQEAMARMANEQKKYEAMQDAQSERRYGFAIGGVGSGGSGGVGGVLGGIFGAKSNR